MKVCLLILIHFYLFFSLAYSSVKQDGNYYDKKATGFLNVNLDSTIFYYNKASEQYEQEANYEKMLDTYIYLMRPYWA